MDLPQTHYAVIGNDRVAYQVIGNGPRDVLLTPGLWSHLDMLWDEPATARATRRLSSFCRLIRFDRRGSGLSDPRPNDGGTLVEHWIADLEAVLDAVGVQAPVILSILDSGPLVLKFYERHPQRCSGLIFGNTTACFAAAPDYPEGHSPKTLETIAEQISSRWGREDGGALFAPSAAGNPALLHWYAKFQRALATPKAVQENLAAMAAIDGRAVLAQVTVPTLVITRRNLRLFPAAQARYLAAHVAGARFEELDGGDFAIVWEDAERLLQLVEEFVTGQRPAHSRERRLATVLFTDIVDSTKLATKLGDAAWRARLDGHDRAVRNAIAQHRGRLVDSAGDGTLAIFDAPGDAIDCAHACHAAVAPLKLKLRAGLHIGELELREDDRVGGIAVHIGARVLGLAKAGDVLVSRTVRDVLIGSRYRFRERGIHELKGVPSKWPLYSVRAGRDA